VPPEHQQRQEYSKHPGDDAQDPGDGGFPGLYKLVLCVRGHLIAPIDQLFI
jgi:hypothetical protein